MKPAGVLMALLLGGAESAPMAAHGQADQRPADAPTPAEVTRQGCLTSMAAPTPTPTGKPMMLQLHATVDGHDVVYRLVTAPKRPVDLDAHVGHLVEVRGRERREGAASAADEQPLVQGGQIQSVGQSATGVSPSQAREASAKAGPQRVLEATMVRTVAETCPAP